VAHFVGTLNAIKVEVRDAATGLLMISGQKIQTGAKTDTVRSAKRRLFLCGLSGSVLPPTAKKPTCWTALWRT